MTSSVPPVSDAGSDEQIALDDLLSTMRAIGMHAPYLSMDEHIPLVEKIVAERDALRGELRQLRALAERDCYGPREG